MNITAAHQHMTHPSCDFARHMMQVALAGTGVWLSDGATNILPVPPHRAEPGVSLSAEQLAENRAAVRRAWKLHYDHIWHSLSQAYYQGWDLHPAQLPSRHAAVYAFFLDGLDAASARLTNFIQKAGQATLAGEIFDDAATGRISRAAALPETEEGEVPIQWSVGWRLDPVLPDAYAHGRYAYGLRERVLGFRFNYSYADLELGYFVAPSLSLRALGIWQIAHGGLRDEDYPPVALSAGTWPEFVDALSGETIRGRPALQLGLHHDQLDMQSFFNLGVGASFAATPSLDLYVLAFRTISGRGGHATNLAISVGTTWSFSPARIIRKKRAAPRPGPGVR